MVIAQYLLIIHNNDPDVIKIFFAQEISQKYYEGRY